MRVHILKHAGIDLLLFPFKAYLFLAPAALWMWREASSEHYVRGALAEAVGRILLGCLLCFVVFLFGAAIRFFTKRRELVAENLIWAGVAFIIMYFLAPFAATA